MPACWLFHRRYVTCPPQGFVRSTTKYWVRTTDVTAVKHHILQHMPVFLFKEEVRLAD